MRAPGGWVPHESLFRGSPEAFLSVTPRGRVLGWTRRAVRAFGYSRAEAIGRPLVTLVVPPEGVEPLQAALARALAEGSASTTAMRRHKDGHVLPPFEVRIQRVGEGMEAALVCSVGLDRFDAGPEGEPVDARPAHPTAQEVRIVRPRLDDLLSSVSSALAASHSATAMLQRTAALVVPRFADWFAADILDGAGEVRREASAHEDPMLAERLRAAPLTTTPAPLSPIAVVQSARPDLAPEPPLDEPASELHRALGVGGHLILPLVGRTRLLGALTFGRAGGRGFEEREVALAMDVARHVALEVENAHLVDVASRSREETWKAVEYARKLRGLSSALSEVMTPAQVTSEAVAQARIALGASGGGVALLSPDHATIEVVSLVGEAEPLSDGAIRFPVHANYPFADVTRSGRTVVLEHLLSGAPRYPYLAHANGARRALAAVPLVIDGRNVGALGLVFPDKRLFPEEDVEFMRALARHVADALERARLYAAERSARALADSEARRSAFLADASRILSSSFDYRSTLESAARLCVPTYAEWCAVYLREKEGRVHAVAAVHADASKMPLARALTQRPPAEGESPASVESVLRTGRPAVFEDLPADMLESHVPEPGTRALVRQLGFRWQVVLPLVARGRTLGALALCASSPRRLSHQDLQLVEELTRRAALAVDNARLYHEVEEAYRRQEESMQALRESEERYRLLVDGATEHAFFLLDTQGLIASWNPGAQRLLGYTADEVLGKSSDLFCAPRTPAAGDAHVELEEALGEGRHEQEGWRYRKNGTRYWASVVVTVLHDEQGNVRGFSELHRDVTDARRFREELDVARRRLVQHEKLSTMGTLVSGVAHEIRTPLTAIANSIHLIRLLAEKGKLTPAAVDRHSGLALEGVDRINALVQDLRRFKRIESTGRETSSLDAVVHEALNLYRAAHRGRVEIVAQLEPTPLCLVDRAQLQQVVLNLLQNASEAMPHGGRVNLRTGRGPNGTAAVHVQDEGVGMTAEVKARMFEEFFTTKSEGTGLGLSIVRRIAELHGGRIDCESAPGKGTTFSLMLPAKP